MAARFYVDELGFVWVGPCKGGGAYRYLRFNGWVDGNERWVWWCEDREEDWEEIDRERVRRVVNEFRKDAERRTR